MAISQKYPTISPSLNINFENSQYIDPFISNTRASTSTFTDKFGSVKLAQNNVPKFDYDPITNKCLGLLVEGSRTNYLLNSENYTFNTSTIGAVVTADTTFAPDETLTADTITANSGFGQHGSTKQSSSIPESSICALSVFVKAGTHNFCRVDSANVTNWSLNAGCGVNLTNGSIIDGAGTVQAYPNGWYRITIIATSNSTAGVSRGMWVWVTDSDGYSSFTATGTETIHVWGAQIEVGQFSSSYIPTTSTSLTRSSDHLQITGSNFTNWHNQNQGTLICKYKNLYTGANPGPLQVVYLIRSSTTNSQLRSPHTNVTRIRLYHNDVFSPNNNTFLTSLNYRKSAYAYSTTESRLMMDGSSSFVSPDVFVHDATKTYISIGSNNNSAHLFGHITQLLYYPVRLTNDQLQALTF